MRALPSMPLFTLRVRMFRKPIKYRLFSNSRSDWSIIFGKVNKAANHQVIWRFFFKSETYGPKMTEKRVKFLSGGKLTSSSSKKRENVCFNWVRKPFLRTSLKLISCPEYVQRSSWAFSRVERDKNRQDRALNSSRDICRENVCFTWELRDNKDAAMLLGNWNWHHRRF